MKIRSAIALMCIISLCACSNKPMKFSSERQGLNELDYHRAKTQCEAEYQTGGWGMIGPTVVVAVVAVVAEGIKQQARMGFQDCMASRGFACKDNCAKDATSVAITPSDKIALAKPVTVPSPSSAPTTTATEKITRDNISVGTTVLPEYEPTALYKEPARDSERIERLSKSSALTVKAISGEWVNVVTATGSSGWVIGSLVGKK